MAGLVGKFKMWNEEKGFGFLKPEGGGKDVFCHVSALKASGFEGDPEVGDAVMFETELGEKGPRAVNVSRA
jgi:CspA family cold shock protein